MKDTAQREKLTKSSHEQKSNVWSEHSSQPLAETTLITSNIRLGRQSMHLATEGIHIKRCNCMSEIETNKHNATTNHANITVSEFKTTTDVKVT
jgi:hypothetical protein